MTASPPPADPITRAGATSSRPPRGRIRVGQLLTGLAAILVAVLIVSVEMSGWAGLAHLTSGHWLLLLGGGCLLIGALGLLPRRRSS